MQLIVINSNSAGNAFVLRSETGEALLIECGVRFQDIKKALGFNLGKVVGCLVSHEHKDHCKSVNDVLNAGIFVYSAYATHETMKTEGHHRSRFLHRHITTGIGPFDVIAYDVKHDAADPFCFLIRHKECGTVLFLTDSYYCEYNFKGLNQVIIEANYCQQILDRRLKDSDDPKMFLRDRVIQSHMSLETCKKTLQAYDLSQVMNIVLIHLSDGNSDEARFQKEVKEATGKLVHIASPGLIVDFNKHPF